MVRQPDPYADEVEKPDGWVVRHSRMTDTVTFGPFATWDEALDWMDANDVGGGALIPCWRTVDWNRT